MNPIYLDNNATTRVDPEITSEILPLLSYDYGNPSSSHTLGENAKKILQIARERVALLLGCESKNIIFTSGGTESNNLAINGLCEGLKDSKHFITSEVEHSSVLETFHNLEKQGHQVTYLPVDKNGLIYAEQVENAIKNNTVLISLMLVNNETGVIFPIKEIGGIAAKYNILFHCDAVQGIGKLPIKVDDLNVDLLTISGHKIHSTKGAGALFIRDINDISPIMLGGHQENGKRSGTEALPAIVGLGKACEIISNQSEEINIYIENNRNLFEQKISGLMKNIKINAHSSPRVCNTSNIQFTGVMGSTLLQKLSESGIYASHGSACSNNHGGNSHVLKAMGLNDSEICSSLRFSLSKETTENDINEAVNRISKVLDDNFSEKKHFLIKNHENFYVSEIDNTKNIYNSFEKELKQLQAETLGEPNISVAIIDGPIDLTNPCFDRNNIEIVDMVNVNYENKGKSMEHGTHVASIILGQNGGIAPKCKGIILPIYSDDSKGNIINANQMTLARAITKAAELGANIINISGGKLVSDEEPEHYLKAAIDICKAKGILIVAAAGNDGCKCLHIPAAIPSVLAVGSMDSTGSPSSFSNFGKAYQIQGILAPGENVLAAIPEGKIAVKSGTSFSTAIVTGVIALLLSDQYKKGIPPNPINIKDIILSTASSCHISNGSEAERCLAGRLNISGAMERIFQENNKIKGRLELMANETNYTLLNDSDLMKSDQNSVGQSECGCSNKTPSLVYALGNLGYDFGLEARLDFFKQYMTNPNQSVKNPYSIRDMYEFLKSQNKKHFSSSLIWTLNRDSTPVYAIKPMGAFNEKAYDFFIETLDDMFEYENIVISIPGIIAGNITLLNGQSVPVIIPEIRGMHSWDPELLSDSVVNALSTQKTTSDQTKPILLNFAKRVYNELRNFGTTSAERALNFSGTNLVQAYNVLSEGVTKGLVLDTIKAKPSPVCRQSSDCWDIELTLFDPKNRTEKAKLVFLYTVDVSDVVPVSIGKIRSWEVYE